MKRMLSLGALAVLCAGVVFSGSEDPATAASAEAPADARFEFLKGLAGSWAGATGDDGSPGVSFEFRVTAGGNAVEAREMAGTPSEMVTLYHLDGDALVATHYCMLGNRPVLRAAPSIENETLAFDCAGLPGGAESHDEQHVHGWTLALADDGKLHIDVNIETAGETTYAPNFVLSRRAAD